MLVREIRMAPAMSALFEQDAAHLIEKVATEAFSPALFRLAYEALLCVHFSAFAVNRANRKTLVLAENTGISSIARHLGHRYIDRYWNLDPVNAAGIFQEPGVRLSEIQAQDIDDPGYRYQCYTATNLGARLSACETRTEGAIRINFYRSRPFSDREKDLVVASLGVLMPLLRRHAHEADKTPETATEFETRLKTVAPELTGRERNVCSLIAAGVTSEGIAYELGISLNTVLTYRKRAYARLRIVSQNQLLKLACMHQRKVALSA